MKRTMLKYKKYKTLSRFLFFLKFQTLCFNKEFFYTSNKKIPDTIITEDEYKNAEQLRINLETVYSDLTPAEKQLYNKSLQIIENYFLQSK